jgi:hypothetical protein
MVYNFIINIGKFIRKIIHFVLQRQNLKKNYSSHFTKIISIYLLFRINIGKIWFNMNVANGKSRGRGRQTPKSTTASPINWEHDSPENPSKEINFGLLEDADQYSDASFPLVEVVEDSKKPPNVESVEQTTAKAPDTITATQNNAKKSQENRPTILLRDFISSPTTSTISAANDSARLSIHNNNNPTSSSSCSANNNNNSTSSISANNNNHPTASSSTNNNNPTSSSNSANNNNNNTTSSFSTTAKNENSSISFTVINSANHYSATSIRSRSAHARTVFHDDGPLQYPVPHYRVRTAQEATYNMRSYDVAVYGIHANTPGVRHELWCRLREDDIWCMFGPVERLQLDYVPGRYAMAYIRLVHRECHMALIQYLNGMRWQDVALQAYASNFPTARPEACCPCLNCSCGCHGSTRAGNIRDRRAEIDNIGRLNRLHRATYLNFSNNNNNFNRSRLDRGRQDEEERYSSDREERAYGNEE